MLDTMHKYLKKEHHLIAVSLVRIGFGTIISLFYILHVFQKDFYWGPNGVYPYENFVKNVAQANSFSLYQLSDSMIYFNFLYFTDMIVALLYTLGFKTRWLGILNFILIWSLFERNPFVLDGGNNILTICLFFLLFANVGAYFTIGKPVRKSHPFLSALHNISILACVLQLAVLYLFSGLYKAQGHMWYNGVALYYVLQIDEFTLPSLAPYFYSNPFILTSITYFTMIFQIAFPFLIWNKSTKWIMALTSMLFHLGIAVIMGLVAFGLTMICIDLLLFNDDAYKKAYLKIASFIEKLKKYFRKFVNPQQELS